MGFWGFVGQHFGYGRGAYRFHRTRARRGTGRLKVEGSFYGECFREPFRLLPPRQAIQMTALLGIWQLANTAGFFYEALAHWRVRDPSQLTLSRALMTEAADADG
jgi:hypothetical protein